MTTPKRISGPIDATAWVDGAKKYAIIEHNDRNDTIEAMVHTAIELAEAHCNLAIGPGVFRQHETRWPSEICIGTMPVHDVVDIRYRDEANAEQVLDAAAWVWAETPEGAVIRFTDAFTTPALNADAASPITVEFEAGYALIHADSPDLEAAPYLIRLAVFQAVKAWFEDGETIGALPEAACDLLNRVRIYR